jgi:hypothetical protein
VPPSTLPSKNAPDYSMKHFERRHRRKAADPWLTLDFFALAIAAICPTFL